MVEEEFEIKPSSIETIFGSLLNFTYMLIGISIMIGIFGVVLNLVEIQFPIAIILILISIMFMLGVGIIGRKILEEELPPEQPVSKNILEFLSFNVAAIWMITLITVLFGLLNYIGWIDYSFTHIVILMMLIGVMNITLVILAYSMGRNRLDTTAPIPVLAFLIVVNIVITVFAIFLFFQDAYDNPLWPYVFALTVLISVPGIMRYAEIPGPLRILKETPERIEEIERVEKGVMIWFSVITFLFLIFFIITIFSTQPAWREMGLPEIDWWIFLLIMAAIPIILLYYSLYIRYKKYGKLLRVKTRAVGNIPRIVSMVISIGLCVVFIILYALSVPQEEVGLRTEYIYERGNMDFIALAVLSITGPFGFYELARLRRLDKIEEKFPDFLRDLAEYWKGGLSMTAAVDTLSKGEYGALNEDVRIMAIQISWGIAFGDVLRLFVERVHTRLIERSISLIEEANKAGGKISDILVTAANDAREIKWLQMERRKEIVTYVTIVYVSFFVYLAIIAILTAVFIPSIADATTALMEQRTEGGIAPSFQVKEIKKEELGFIFYCSGMVQALGNGIVGGIMGEGTLASGLRHAFIMALAVWLTFTLLIFDPLGMVSTLSGVIYG